MANVEYKGKVPVKVTVNEKETRKCNASVGWVTIYFAKPDELIDDKLMDNEAAEKFVRKQLEMGIEEAMKTYKR